MMILIEQLSCALTLNRLTLIALLCLISGAIFAQADMYTLYVGTYTRKGSHGIYGYRFNAKTGDVTPITQTKGLSSPSFLAIPPSHRFLYALGGVNGDSVRAFSIDRQSHELTLLNTQYVLGAGAAHVAVDKTGQWVIVGNYRSGNLTVLPVQADGSLGKAIQSIQHEGKSIDLERQDHAYVHSINIAPNNRDVFVPDLGMDKIMTYTLNEKTGQLSPGNPPFTSVTPGSGPRHFTFHPNGKFAYVIQEMGALVTGFAYASGKLTPIQTISTLPTDYTGRKWAADIHISPDGRFLYASNRAHESLAIFSIDPQTGQLTLVGHQPVNGKTPRNFAIDPTGNFVLVANQDSDNITIFKRDKQTGKLTPTGNEIQVSMPVCLKFVPN